MDQTIIIQSLLELLPGLFLGLMAAYFAYKFGIKKENINVNRNRLLINISKVEDYISVMLEISFLKEDILRTRENMLFQKESLETLELVKHLIEEEIIRLSNEMENGEFENQSNVDLFTKLQTIKLQANKIRGYVQEKHEFTIANEKEIQKRQEQLNNLKQRILNDDINANCLTIDPSGKIAEYIIEMGKISSDENISFHSDVRATELRIKVNQLIQKIIKKIW